jgi:prepilin-type N-terminal cleavage/methylation domain-containing protein
MKKSFTLIEILVVIVVIGVLSAFILVGMSSISSKANIAKGQAFSNSLRNSLLINLVSEWKFEGPTTVGGVATVNDAKDSWRTDNASLIGGNPIVKSSSDCVSGKCIYFDGSGDYVSINSGPVLNNKPITISLWIKEPSSATYGTFIIGGTTYGGFLRDNSGSYEWDLYDTSEHNIFTPIPSYNQWHNVVGTYDGSIQKIYVDGVMKNSQSLSITPATTSNISFGACLFCGPSQFTTGFLDEVVIYNIAVPTVVIEQNYYTGLSKLYKNNGITLNEFNLRLVELKSNLVVSQF